MTVSILIALLGIGLFDCLNPATITILLMLLSRVKKTWHSAIFIWSTYLVYLLAGFLIYFGIDFYIREWFAEFSQNYAVLLGILQILLAVLCLAAAVVLVLRIVIEYVTKKPIEFEYETKLVKSVAPTAIVLIAVAATALDVPTAFPYFAFIGILLNYDLSVFAALPLLAVYCLIYIAPLLLLQITYNHEKDNKFSHIADILRDLVNKSNTYLLPILFAVAGIWLIVGAIARF